MSRLIFDGLDLLTSLGSKCQMSDVFRLTNEKPLFHNFVFALDEQFHDEAMT